MIMIYVQMCKIFNYVAVWYDPTTVAAKLVHVYNPVHVAARLVHVYNPFYVAARLVCSPLVWQ